MESEANGFKNPSETAKGDLVEIKVDEKGCMDSPKSDSKKVMVEEVKQPFNSPEEVKDENGNKGWEQIRVLMTILLLMNLYFIPLRLHEAYLTDGLLSRCFAYFALCGVMFLLTFFASFEMIGPATFTVLMIPAMIGFVATMQWDIFVFLTMAGVLGFFIIIFCSLVIYDKYFGKTCELKDTPPSI